MFFLWGIAIVGVILVFLASALPGGVPIWDRQAHR